MTKWDSSLSLVEKYHIRSRAKVPVRDVATAFWEMQNGLTPREARLLIRCVNWYWKIRRRKWISFYTHHRRAALTATEGES